jgi:hypothetical protein
MASIGHKKLSGAQNRAKAKKKVDEDNKNKRTLRDLGFFTETTTTTSSTCTSSSHGVID